MPLLDEHGVSTGEVPGFVTPATLKRWVMCAEIAKAVTRQPILVPECQLFASSLFYSDIEDGEVTALPKDLLEGLPGVDFDPTRHLHDRRGRFREMPEAPGARKSLPAPPASPGIPDGYTEADLARLDLHHWPDPGPAAKAILGEAKDTKEIHGINLPMSPGTEPYHEAPYKESRKAVHDPIVASFFEGKTPPKLADGERPRAVFTAGGPASGKTTTLDRLKAQGEELLPPERHTVHVDPDLVKEKMDEYTKLVEAQDPYAATAVHKESGDIAARIALEAMKRGFHLTLDQTGDGATGSFRALLDQVHGNGYDPHVVYVNAPTETAVEFAIVRALEKGRLVPIPEVRRQHKMVSSNFLTDVVDNPHVKGLDVIDGGEHIATLDERGSLRIHDRRKFLAFVAKADEALPTNHPEVSGG